MDTITISGTIYTFDIATKTIKFKNGNGMNNVIRIFKYGIDESILKAVAEYSGILNNTDLLVTSGMTEQEAENKKYEVSTKYRGQAKFVPDSFGNPSLTDVDIKKWINEICEKHFKFVPYDPENNYNLITV